MSTLSKPAEENLKLGSAFGSNARSNLRTVLKQQICAYPGNKGDAWGQND